MIKTATGLHETPQTAIKKAWTQIEKMDWTGLENVLRHVLRDCPPEHRNETVKTIDEAIAAFTLRGNEFPEEADKDGRPH